jgi:AcrR family transcriptional regulator
MAGTVTRRRSQAERSEATVQDLVAAARPLFAERGFAGTSIEDIVRAAGVTRGALYHHFESKTDVFRAVFEEEERRLVEHTKEVGMRRRRPWAQVEAGCVAVLDAYLDPAIQQIVLIDGPAVLGWTGVREIQYRYGLSTLQHGIEHAMEAGELRKRPAAPLAHLLFGAICEGSMAAARAADREATMRAVRRELKDLMDAVSQAS